MGGNYMDIGGNTVAPDQPWQWRLLSLRTQNILPGLATHVAQYTLDLDLLDVQQQTALAGRFSSD